MKIFILAWGFLVPHVVFGISYAAGYPEANAHLWRNVYLRYYNKEEKAALLQFLAQKKRVIQTYLFAQAEGYVNNPRISSLCNDPEQKKKLYNEYCLSSAHFEMTILWSDRTQLLQRSWDDINSIVSGFPDRNGLRLFPNEEVNEGYMFLSALQKLIC